MNHYWHLIQNLGEHAQLRKTPRLFPPLVKLDETDFTKRCHEAIQHGTDLSSATGKFNALGTFAERNAKKGKSCQKSEPSACRWNLTARKARGGAIVVAVWHKSDGTKSGVFRLYQRIDKAYPWRCLNKPHLGGTQK